MSSQGDQEDTYKQAGLLEPLDLPYLRVSACHNVTPPFSVPFHTKSYYHTTDCYGIALGFHRV